MYNTQQKMLHQKKMLYFQSFITHQNKCYVNRFNLIQQAQTYICRLTSNHLNEKSVHKKKLRVRQDINEGRLIQ